MKLENHMKKLDEHLEGLEWGIKQNNHSSVGFHASQGAVELISIYLHKLNLITGDIQLKHTWFRSQKAIEEKLDFDFPRKEDMLGVVGEIEDMRDPLCYGAPKPEELISVVAEKFRSLKNIIENELGEKIG